MTGEPHITRAWPEIAAHFRATPWPSAQAVADLCDHIDGSTSGANLLGSISGLVLRIDRKGSANGGYLEIAPSERGPTQFRHIDTLTPERMWRRHEPPENVVERFTKAMELLGWISES